jgi:hypothetical protein
MASGYRPDWLRLSEAIEFLKTRGLQSQAAKTALQRMIQDRLFPKSPGGTFRLPNWQYHRRFAERSWVTAPKIDWKNSTIVAPFAMGMRRVDRPTLIEVSAAALDHGFSHAADQRSGTTDEPLRKAPPGTPTSSSARKHRQAKIYPVLRKLYPEGLPDEVSNEELYRAVMAELPKGTQVSKDTVLRAALRRK